MFLFPYPTGGAACVAPRARRVRADSNGRRPRHRRKASVRIEPTATDTTQLALKRTMSAQGSTTAQDEPPIELRKPARVADLAGTVCKEARHCKPRGHNVARVHPPWRWQHGRDVVPGTHRSLWQAEWAGQCRGAAHPHESDPGADDPARVRRIGRRARRGSPIFRPPSKSAAPITQRRLRRLGLLHRT
jgi:hypothetical protein